jgi:ABC-2 type transport system permease protein
MNWRQVFLVLKREYMTRFKSKGFIWATILVPVGFILLFGLGIAIAVWESDVSFEIGIVDETGNIYSSLAEIDNSRYLDASGLSVDSVRALVQNEELTGYIIISENHILNDEELELIYSGAGGINLLSSVRSDLRDVIRRERIRLAEVPEDVQRIFNSRIEVESRRLSSEGEETEDDTEFLSFIGMLMGVIIFAAIFGYGGYIMRGVIEEKTNRIIEVITSSVKPIELLTGKMAGVGALAATQLGIWTLSFFALISAAGPVAMMFMPQPDEIMNSELADAAPQLPGILDIPEIETSLIVYFVIFFILGYLLYSSLFAAIGSASDSETDSQQLMLPVMAPIFIAYFIMFQATTNPDGTLAVAGSLVPFFTPIVMITRIAITEVPFWQIGLAIFLMAISFVGTMWLSAKIYRIGILSYGSTAGFKDLFKWIRQ